VTGFIITLSPLSSGFRRSFPGVKAEGHEADHSLPSNAEVKNAWRYASSPRYVFMPWCLGKHRNSFTFTFTITTLHYSFSVVKFGSKYQ